MKQRIRAEENRQLLCTCARTLPCEIPQLLHSSLPQRINYHPLIYLGLCMCRTRTSVCAMTDRSRVIFSQPDQIPSISGTAHQCMKGQ